MPVFQAAALALIALIISPGLFFYFDVTPKVIVLLAAAAACLAALPWTPAGRAARRFGLLASLTLLSLASSAAFSSNPALSLFGTNWRRFGAVGQAAVLVLAWSVAAHAAGRPDRARAVLRAIAAATALMAAYGILQYAGFDPLLPAGAYHVGEGIWTIVRPPGTLGYVSYFATWLAGAAFICLALAEIEAHALPRRLALAGSALALLAMALTGTRAAFLGVAAGALYALARGRIRFSRRRGAVVLVGTIAAAGFLFSPLGWQLRSRARWFREDAWGGARLALWRDGVRMGIRRLPAGHGPEVFTAEFPHFESPQLARAYPDFAHESPHNIFLDALVAQGLAGPLLLGAFAVAGLRSRNRWLGAALSAILVSQQFTVFTVPTALLFYCTIALAMSLASGAAEDERKTRFAWAAAPAALALLYCAARFGVADAALASAQKNLQQGRLEASLGSWKQYVAWRLPGSSSGIWYSRALLNAKAIRQAGAPSIDAARFAEDPFNAWYNRAQVCAAGGDASCVESSLRAAIAAHPNWFKPHLALAGFLRLEERMEEAESEASQAAFLNNGKDAEVAGALHEIRLRRAATAAHLH